MSSITVRPATPQEQSSCADWDLWDTGTAAHYEHVYDRGVQFIVQQGEAEIHLGKHTPVTVRTGDCVTIEPGATGRWDIHAPVVNRWRYR